MSAIEIRRGRPDDLVACTSVWRATVDQALPAATEAYPLYAHEAATGTLLVAEQAGSVVGFAGSVVRHDRWFLADLFVSPAMHGVGLGRRLLDALFEIDRPGDVRATMGSSDPRALTLYSQFGMVPRWPCFWIGGGERVDVRVPEGVTAVTCDPDELTVVAGSAGYALHGIDVEYWRALADARCVMVAAGGRAVGGGVVRRATPFSIVDPTAVSLGPVVAVSPEWMLPTVLAVIDDATAAAGGRAVKCFVPGSNPALAPLLHAGMQIEDFDLFCASNDRIIDPQTVLPSHDLL